jgi:hypothetical protein
VVQVFNHVQVFGLTVCNRTDQSFTSVSSLFPRLNEFIRAGMATKFFSFSLFLLNLLALHSCHPIFFGTAIEHLYF